MTRTRRTVAALVASLALVAPTSLTLSLATAADAKPHGDKPGKAQTKQLLKDIAREDKHLVKLATSHAVTDLGDANEAGVVANIAEARAVLADLEADVEAAGSTVDTRAARKELRAFRVQNLRHAAHVLEQVEELADDAAADTEAQTFLAQAQAAALAVEATSPKDEVKAAKALLESAKAELEGSEDEDEAAPTA